MARRPPFSAAALARIRLVEIARIGKELQRRGDAFETEQLLRVITNLLSSVPRSQLSSRRDSKPKLYPLNFIIPVVVFWAFECGIRVSVHEASQAIKATKRWRERVDERRGKADRRPMSMDGIGKTLNITPELRETVGAWNIGTIGGSSAQRAKARHGRKVMRNRLRERERGVMPRALYEAHSLSQLRPWEAQGISRRTWERRRQQQNDRPSCDEEKPLAECRKSKDDIKELEYFN